MIGRTDKNAQRDWRKLVFGEFTWKRLLRSILFVVAAVYGTLFGMALFLGNQLIFRPQPSSYQDSADIIKLKSTDGNRISCRHLTAPDSHYTILYSHGNAEDLGNVTGYMRQLQKRGHSIIAYDYQGYGTSEGSPTEDGAYADIRAVYKYLTETKGIPADRIIIFGRSVGSGPAIDLAKAEPVAGLIVESGFITAYRVVTRIPIVPIDRFRNIDKIAKVGCPVLFIHGERDQVIPIGHGKKLFAVASEPRQSLWIPGAGHDDVEFHGGSKYWQTIDDFIAALPEPSSSSKQ